jgi:glycosyltransferase involved in cell wall biosynthesis
MAGGTISGQEFALEEFKQQIINYKIEERVEFVGYLKDRSDFDNYFANAYCCVIPAVITISASGPLSKVFGYHKCTIASKIGNYNEEIVHKYDGYLVDNDKWGEAFSELVKAIEVKSAKKAQTRSWKTVANLHKELYAKFLLE